MTRSRLLKIFNEKGELVESFYQEDKISSGAFSAATLALMNDILKTAYGESIVESLLSDIIKTKKIISTNKEEDA
jgi:hypothetical protein